MLDALVDYALELESITSNSGVEFLQGLRDKALAKISNGSATEYISATVDGQTFATSVQVSASDMFAAAQSALRMLQGRAVKFTYATFCNIPH